MSEGEGSDAKVSHNDPDPFGGEHIYARADRLEKVAGIVSEGRTRLGEVVEQVGEIETHVAVVSTHVEYLRAGQDRLEKGVEKLVDYHHLNDDDREHPRRRRRRSITIFGAGFLASVAAIVAPIVALVRRG